MDSKQEYMLLQGSNVKGFENFNSKQVHNNEAGNTNHSSSSKPRQNHGVIAK